MIRVLAMVCVLLSLAGARTERNEEAQEKPTHEQAAKEYQRLMKSAAEIMKSANDQKTADAAAIKLKALRKEALSYWAMNAKLGQAPAELQVRFKKERLDAYLLYHREWQRIRLGEGIGVTESTKALVQESDAFRLAIVRGCESGAKLDWRWSKEKASLAYSIKEHLSQTTMWKSPGSSTHRSLSATSKTVASCTPWQRDTRISCSRARRTLFLSRSMGLFQLAAPWWRSISRRARPFGNPDFGGSVPPAIRNTKTESTSKPMASASPFMATNRMAATWNNSITQGEQPSLLWPNLSNTRNEDTTHRTFRGKARREGKPMSMSSSSVRTNGTTIVNPHHENGAEHGVHSGQVTSILSDRRRGYPLKSRSANHRRPSSVRQHANDDGNLSDDTQKIYSRRRPSRLLLDVLSARRNISTISNGGAFEIFPTSTPAMRWHTSNSSPTTTRGTSDGGTSKARRRSFVRGNSSARVEVHPDSAYSSHEPLQFS